MASVAGYAPTPGYATYSATKSYVLNFSYALTHELKALGAERRRRRGGEPHGLRAHQGDHAAAGCGTLQERHPLAGAGVCAASA